MVSNAPFVRPKEGAKSDSAIVATAVVVVPKTVNVYKARQTRSASLSDTRGREGGVSIEADPMS